MLDYYYTWRNLIIFYHYAIETFFRIKDPSKGPVPNHSATPNDTHHAPASSLMPFSNINATAGADRREIAREPDAAYYLLFRRIFLITRPGGAKKEPVESRVT